MDIGSLGDVVFETSANKILTPSRVTFSRGAKYEDHAVQNGFPASEYINPELGKASFSITLRRDLGCDPVREAEKLERMCIGGEVVRFMLLGENLGRWTVRSVSQDWRHGLKGMTGPLSINLQIELMEYY